MSFSVSIFFFFMSEHYISSMNCVFHNKLTIGILVFILFLVLAFGGNPVVEGLTETVPIPETGVIPYGYFRIDDENMSKLPYGYEVDPSDPTMKTIVPFTGSSFYKAKPVAIPSTGIPDGHYLVSDGFMGILPPKMKANVVSINPNGSFKYDVGYINEISYYARRFPIPKDPANPTEEVRVLPPGTFLNDDKKTISILPYGKLANGRNTEGYYDNPYLLSKSGKYDFSELTYKDIHNKFDVEYHESADKILQRDSYLVNDMSYGAITVLSPSGEYIVIPRSTVEGDITYLKPGSFKYEPSNYVPNYEDSVFLSRVTYLPTTSYYTPSDVKKGFCELYKNDKTKMEINCNTLSPDACASSTCCVLLGGAKCVSGNMNGPFERSNYSDVLLRNKDFYYYQGKCFGNCI